jgi:predicted phage terminase large subunit-like protein
LGEIERERARRDFDVWLDQVTPTWEWRWRHLVYIRTYLDRVTRGDLKRLMLFVPPRHGKSEQTTIRYPTWRLERDPTLRVIVGAYNQILANKFSRKARRIAVQRMDLSAERVAVEDWETAQGGGFRVVGVGGGITGQGGDLIIIDDPVKNREEANSQAYRDRVWEWYTDDLYTRLEPGAAIILIMTRWHEDDLAGRILVSDDAPSWTVVKLPAEAEENDPMGRKPGEALCPERYPLENLKRIHQVLGNSYYALYQQTPVAPEGEMFKRAWFETVKETPAQGVRVRYWDKAGTAGGGAYTCGVLMNRHEGMYYVEDVVRGQWAAAERERVIKQTAQADKDAYGRVVVWIEQEPGSGGKESAEATIRNLAGFIVKADKVTGDKVTRAEPFAAQSMAGNVKLKRARWNGAYLDELTTFPASAQRDQVDGSSGAFNKLAATGKAKVAMVEW